MAQASGGVFYGGGSKGDMGGVPGGQPRSVPEDLMPSDRPPNRQEQLANLMRMMKRGNARKVMMMHMLNERGKRQDTLPMATGSLSSGDMSGEGK